MIEGRGRRWANLPGFLALIIAASLLTACGGGDGPESTPAPEATDVPEPTATLAPDASLGEVTWSTALGDDGAPEGELESFSREAEVIHASVEVANLAGGETLTATWTINGTEIEGMTSTVTIDQATASGWASFSLTWNGAALWPTGTLGVIITASNGMSASGEIQIVSGQ